MEENTPWKPRCNRDFDGFATAPDNRYALAATTTTHRYMGLPRYCCSAFMVPLWHGKAGGNTLGRSCARYSGRGGDTRAVHLLSRRGRGRTWETGSIQPLPIIIPWTFITSSPFVKSVSKQQHARPSRSKEDN